MRCCTLLSGYPYRIEYLKAYVIASIAFSDGPNGFSFEESLANAS